MRVNSITNSNYLNTRTNRTRANKTIPNSDTSFKGKKGAIIGALAGVGYVAVASALSGPFFPLTLGVLATGAGVGALAGHNIEEEGPKPEDDDKNNGE